MSVSARALTSSALLYPQKIALTTPALYLVSLAQAQYRAASFLDDRLLDGAAAIGWVPLEPVETAIAAIQPLPLSFIFHAGHVGSTLLSRLLDDVPGVLGLREPLPLRSLAETEAGRHAMRRWLRVLLPLWGRGFDGTRQVIIKATSIAGRLAPDVMAEVPQAHAVYLNLRPEPYLSVLLAGENSLGDLEGMTHERLGRLRSQLGEELDRERALTVGEGAAVAWLAESLAQTRAAQATGPRLLQLDFDDMLADMPAALARVLSHFSLPPEALPGLLQSPTLTRYSKLSGDQPYSPQLRRQMMDQARRDQAAEIALGMALVERMAARHPMVAALMER
jgi:hypothetical protein